MRTLLLIVLIIVMIFSFNQTVSAQAEIPFDSSRCIDTGYWAGEDTTNKESWQQYWDDYELIWGWLDTNMIWVSATEDTAVRYILDLTEIRWGNDFIRLDCFKSESPQEWTTESGTIIREYLLYPQLGRSLRGDNTTSKPLIIASGNLSTSITFYWMGPQ